MPLYTHPDMNNDIDLGNFPTTFWQGMAATADAAWDYALGIGSLRAARLTSLRGEWRPVGKGARFVEFADDPDGWLNRMPPKKILSKEEATALGSQHGVSFDRAVPKDYVDAMILDAIKRQRRNSVLARTTPGLAAGTARFVMGLFATALDPPELAVSLVPMVGPAKRFMAVERALARLGRFRGTAEAALSGALGAAATEPMVWHNMSERQIDYTAYDTMLNIGFGGALGGGLHIGAAGLKRLSVGRGIREQAALQRAAAEGKAAGTIERGRRERAVEIEQAQLPTVPERIEAMTMDSKEGALRNAVASLESGKRAETEGDILTRDPDYQDPYATPVEREAAARPADPAEVNERVGHAAARAASPDDGRTDLKDLAETARKVEESPDRSDAEKMAELVEDEARSLDRVVRDITDAEVETLREEGVELTTETRAAGADADAPAARKMDYSKFDAEMEAARKYRDMLDELSACLGG